MNNQEKENIFDFIGMNVWISEHIVHDTQEDGSIVMYDEFSKETHLLNNIAGLVFKLCDGRSETDIYNDYRSQIDIDGVDITDEQLRFEYLDVINMLLQKGVCRLEGKT